jgi:hypothetical protein
VQLKPAYSETLSSLKNTVRNDPIFQLLVVLYKIYAQQKTLIVTLFLSMFSPKETATDVLICRSIQAHAGLKISFPTEKRERANRFELSKAFYASDV